jgi:hypothetical protein
LDDMRHTVSQNQEGTQEASLFGAREPSGIVLRRKCHDQQGQP